MVKARNGNEFGKTFLITTFVGLFFVTVVQSLLEGRSLLEGLWLFLKVLPWGIMMIFLVSLTVDKSLLFEDDEHDSGDVLE
ncbi:hypothetical protein [Thermococcus sp.]|uniref:hypothetical protein n=1 Tax=Thermococcus sp. TaxID=35749 RepID=UPI0025DC0085|nr:hypothetical protein [Thermococcus sp.]